jgi:hypothetical protein
LTAARRRTGGFADQAQNAVRRSGTDHLRTVCDSKATPISLNPRWVSVLAVARGFAKCNLGAGRSPTGDDASAMVGPKIAPGAGSAACIAREDLTSVA